MEEDEFSRIEHTLTTTHGSTNFVKLWLLIKKFELITLKKEWKGTKKESKLVNRESLLLRATNFLTHLINTFLMRG